MGSSVVGSVVEGSEVEGLVVGTSYSVVVGDVGISESGGAVAVVSVYNV